MEAAAAPNRPPSAATLSYSVNGIAGVVVPECAEFEHPPLSLSITRALFLDPKPMQFAQRSANVRWSRNIRHVIEIAFWSSRLIVEESAVAAVAMFVTT